MDIEDYQLFDTATGHSRAWFWRGPNGEYEFFDNQGFNPTNGEALKQFTSEEIARWKKERQLAKEYQEQEERKRLQEKHLRRDTQERRQAREREAAERVEKAEAEKQRTVAEAIDRCDRLAANPHDPKKPASILGARLQKLRKMRRKLSSRAVRPSSIFRKSRDINISMLARWVLNNPDEAIAIYRRLAAQIYPAAFDNLASLLLQRRDKKSIKQAITVLKDGVRNGDPDAMVTLAAWVGTSELPVQNPFAYKLMLLKKAASLGNQDAKEAADELERQA